MKLIINGINGNYLREITENAVNSTEYVQAAVAYATNIDIIFDWCWNKGIPLSYWGRYDANIPVSLPILKSFLTRRSPNYTCKLAKYFHAKVIWWHGYGAYIGSANLTDSAWYKNIEAGCFFDEAELEASGGGAELRAMFQKLDMHSSPLTDELYSVIERRDRELQSQFKVDADSANKFLNANCIHQWEGLTRESKALAIERQKKAFLDEWYKTLQYIRDIGERISAKENRPNWIPESIPAGAQADQFLHAHYYNNVIGKDRRSMFAEQFEANRLNPEAALQNVMSWWRGHSQPPSNEDRMLFEWAPYLREALSEERLSKMTPEQFENICYRVHSIQDHARRVSNKTLGLPGNVTHDIAKKTKHLASYLQTRRSTNGSTVIQVLQYVLYGGSESELPVRIWEAVSDEQWRIEHFGISAIGELVGWAFPDRFPPRNNRTSKALRSLGYDVDFHG